VSLLVIAAAACSDDDDASSSGTTASTTTTAAPSAPVDTSSPVGHYVADVSVEGRPELEGEWGFNIEADGTWSLCPGCTTVPGTFGATYSLEGDRITLQPDSTCAVAVPYRWTATEDSLALEPLEDDPCGLSPGNRQIVLTQRLERVR
jgi:hypothetical protein